MFNFGVDFIEKDANGKWKANFNTPETVEALEYIKDAYRVYSELSLEYYRDVSNLGLAKLYYNNKAFLF